MTDRQHHLDGLRGLAALNVMLSHAIPAFDFALFTGHAAEAHGSWELPLSGLPFLLPVAGANFSVSVFLVLSGFVLAPVFERPGLGVAALLAKRTMRLAVPILAATLLGWALLASGAMHNHAAAALTRSGWLDMQLRQRADLGDALSEGLYRSLVGPWDFSRSYDSSLWTMPLEFAGSGLLILLFAVRRWLGWGDTQQRAMGLALMVVGILLEPLFLSLIVIGAGMAMLDLRRWMRLSTGLAVAGVVLALLLGTVPYSDARFALWGPLIRHLSPGPLLPWHTLPGLPGLVPMDAVSLCHGVGAILLVAVVTCSAWLRRALSRPFAVWLGRISFPLYLVHIPLLLSGGCFVLLWANGLGLSYGAAVACAVAAYCLPSLALAELMARFVERPAIRLAAWSGLAVQSAFRPKTVPGRP